MTLYSPTPKYCRTIRVAMTYCCVLYLNIVLNSVLLGSESPDMICTVSHVLKLSMLLRRTGHKLVIIMSEGMFA